MTARTAKQVNDDSNEIITEMRLKINTLDTNVKYIKEAQAISDKKHDRLENKVDGVLDGMSKFHFVTVGQLADYKKEVKEMLEDYVTNERANKYFRSADVIAYAFALAIVAAVAKFILDGGLR